MKIFFTILFFTVLSANATVYYVSNAGSDANNGTSTGTSWQTIAKVNAQTFAAGDQILFKAGDTWNEKLIPPSSGTAANPITFGAYSTGLKPTITGLQSLGGFTNTSGNIWSATATNSVANLNTVLIGGALRAKGRYPNTGSYLQTNAVSTVSQIKTALTGTPDYTGAELVFNAASYVKDIVKVASQSIGTLNVSPNVTYPTNGNDKFFFQNRVDFLDQQNEWCLDSAIKLLSIYSVGSPSSVQVSSIDTLVDINKKDNLTFDGINFTGANNVGLYLDTVKHITIQNCITNYMGGNNIGPAKIEGVSGAAIMGRNAVGCTIQNDSILNSLNNGISTIYYCDSLTISGNYIKNSGYIEGMGAGSNGAYNGVFHGGKYLKFNNNRIDSTGYAPLFFAGNFDTVKYNYISNFCYVKDDGGGIYTAPGGATDWYDTSSLVRSNIIVNGKGAGLNNIAVGIYLDDNTNKVTVDSNTVYNCNFAGIFLHNNNKIAVTNNTIVDSLGNCFAQSGSSSSGGTGGISYYNNNIFYSKIATKYTLSYGFSVGSTVMDYNYYLRPISETNKIFNALTGLSYSSVAAWSAVYGFETHGSDTPMGITAAGVLYYNATLMPATTALSGSYIDAKGAAYNNSITLQPFQSAILFVSSIQLPKAFGNLIFQ